MRGSAGAGAALEILYSSGSRGQAARLGSSDDNKQSDCHIRAFTPLPSHSTPLHCIAALNHSEKQTFTRMAWFVVVVQYHRLNNL